MLKQLGQTTESAWRSGLKYRNVAEHEGRMLGGRAGATGDHESELGRALRTRTQSEQTPYEIPGLPEETPARCTESVRAGRGKGKNVQKLNPCEEGPPKFADSRCTRLF